MIKELSKYPKTINQFCEYLKKLNIDLTIFFKLDFNYRIGFYIEFLSIRNITICFDSFNYIVFCDKEYSDAMSLIKPHIITESNNSNITNIIYPLENFKLGLIEAFKHLEQPF